MNSVHQTVFIDSREGNLRFHLKSLLNCYSVIRVTCCSSLANRFQRSSPRTSTVRYNESSTEFAIRQQSSNRSYARAAFLLALSKLRLTFGNRPKKSAMHFFTFCAQVNQLSNVIIDEPLWSVGCWISTGSDLRLSCFDPLRRSNYNRYQHLTSFLRN